MKHFMEEIAPQFIVDKAGKKTAVILDIATFQHLIDELEDFYLGVLAQAALRDDKETVSHEQVKKDFAKKILKDE